MVGNIVCIPLGCEVKVRIRELGKGTKVYFPGRGICSRKGWCNGRGSHRLHERSELDVTEVKVLSWADAAEGADSIVGLLIRKVALGSFSFWSLEGTTFPIITRNTTDFRNQQLVSAPYVISKTYFPSDIVSILESIALFPISRYFPYKSQDLVILSHAINLI